MAKPGMLIHVQDRPSLRVTDLTKRYGSVTAVDAASLKVRQGEIFGLLGPNGAGKTTTLECVLGLRKPDAGAIEVEGIDALARPDEAKQIVGAVLQATALQDKITPRQALRLFAAFHRNSEKPATLLARFGLEEKADATFDALSGGQRQRLALALAFVNRPRLLILDEPTAGLDPAARRKLHAIIQERRHNGCTVLLSTHQLDEAEHLCDRVAIIDHGRIVALGTPAELINRANMPTRVSIKTLRPIDPSRFRALAAVASCERYEDRLLVTTHDINHVLMDATRMLASEANELADLRIQHPTLENVFLERTGRAWTDANRNVPEEREP